MLSIVLSTVDPLKLDKSNLINDKHLSNILEKSLENGLVILSAGQNVLRFLPPLVIEKKHIDEFKEKLSKVFDSMS